MPNRALMLVTKTYQWRMIAKAASPPRITHSRASRLVLRARPAKPGAMSPMSAFHQERVLSVRHWTDRLFSFRTTRAPAFRFRSGQFVMMGLERDGRPLLRAYSLASAHYEGELEFFSIKVPDGPLTSRLQHLKEGDEVLIGRKPTGTLIVDNLQARPHALPARHRHRPRALLQHRQGPGSLRQIRAHRRRPRGADGSRISPMATISRATCRTTSSSAILCGGR